MKTLKLNMMNQSLLMLGLLSCFNSPSWALVEVAAVIPPSLKSVPVPEPANLTQFVKNKQAAIALGKAFFWDMQVGSDGQACASCHYHAGADHRTKNQLNPGAPGADGISKLDPTFNQAKNTSAAPNYTLKPTDFPFHRLADPFDRNSKVKFDSNDVAGSQGVFQRNFVKMNASNKEGCTSVVTANNAIGGISVRQTTGRNSPSVINAVYNFRNFWDGRANNRFNGLDPFGDRRPYDATSTNNIMQFDTKSKKYQPVHVQIDDASLASQAVGPALSSGEMTCSGMQFRYLAKKLLPLVPLAKQQVEATDSVLGSYANKTTGLKPNFTYSKMIQDAFQPSFWSGSQKINGYSQLEQNFSLFWGLAIQMYEATLVSDDSPYDKYRENPVANPLTDQEINGLNVFAGKGMCITCHRGAEFTAASKAHVTENYAERMLLSKADVALYDTGFYNIGVRPTVEDLGLGGKDAYGNPLSFTRLALKIADGLTDLLSLGKDPVTVDSWSFLMTTGLAVDPNERDAVDGSFKTPGLRNIELTGPYFHNGAYGTLAQVVQFYNRGGDRRENPFGDTSGYQNNPSNLAADMAGHIDPLEPGVIFPTLGINNTELNDVVSFMKTLTDDRVRWEKAPFDHPSLPLFNGHLSTATGVKSSTANVLEAQDIVETLPAVGAQGRAAKKLAPLAGF